MEIKDSLPHNKDQRVDQKRLRNKTILYWSSALVILIVLLAIVLYATQPPQQPVITPDISATLEKALADALGPPTATTTASLSPSPTQTTTISLTPLPTLTGTPTLTPTLTGTGSLTPAPPTLTPILPNNVDEAFELVPLSPSQYNYAIALMEGAPQLLPGGQDNEEYYLSYYHAEVIQSEAALHYPNNQYTNDWQWSEALNLAKINDKRATLAYATLLSKMINEAGLTLHDLPSQVKHQDPSLALEIQEVPPYKGNSQNNLIEMQTPGGSIFLWFTIRDGNNTFYTLSDETNFAQPTTSKLLWSDLTGDAKKELVIFTPTAGLRQIDTPNVFDLTQSPPRQLQFKPNDEFDIGLENTLDWTISSNEQDYFDLEFETTVYPPCPVTIHQDYRWSGTWFERVAESYEAQPVTQMLDYCEFLVDQANSAWGLQAAIQIMESLLPFWPPQSTSEKTYPLDAKDQLQYRLGVYHTLVGNLKNAQSYFESIIQSPVTPGSRWITPARDFLEASQTPWGIYTACVASEFCDNRLALKNWVSTLTTEEARNALFYLSSKGVAIRYSDVFDFDGDGTTERWFTFRHSYLDRLELWILLINESGAQALFVDTVDTNQPTLTRYTDFYGQTYVWIGSQQSFRLLRYSYTDEAFIELLPPSYFYAKITNQLAEHALDALMSGLSPRTILDQLVSHEGSTDFVCLSKEECARFYYALGLAAELTGDETLAVKSYLKIWWDSFESPFSTIVRLKLAYKPGYGPIATAPPIPTLIPTWTPTQTRTPSPTLSPTPTGSVTLTPTTTEDPNMTWTPSPTITNTPTPTNTSDGYPIQ